MGLHDDPYLAFCFDEACEYILSMQTTKEVIKKKKTYLQEVWIKEPKWIDIEVKSKPLNNSELIKQMKKELEKFKC